MVRLRCDMPPIVADTNTDILQEGPEGPDYPDDPENGGGLFSLKAQ